MVLVLESVSCLTPTEFKTLQAATSQLEKALNNSAINHGKSTASLEDICLFCFWYFFFCVGAELKSSCWTRTNSTGCQDCILQDCILQDLSPKRLILIIAWFLWV